MAVFLLAGCAAGAAEPSPYRAEFDDALSRASSEFERQVLSDYQISKAEYDEAVAMVVECARVQGVEISVEEVLGSGSRYSVAGGGEAVYDTCSMPLSSIELLYTAQLQNPENRPFEELVVECLRAKGLVPESFTVEAWRREQAAGSGISTEPDPEVMSCSSAPNER